MNIAVIVTTYNRPDALAALFSKATAPSGTGISRSSWPTTVPEPETAAVVAAYRERAASAIDHVWQEDRGFRAAAIRNRALALTKADYVIFTDGDCLPLPDFIAGHRRLAERGWFVAGNRILMAEQLEPAYPGGAPAGARLAGGEDGLPSS